MKILTFLLFIFISNSLAQSSLNFYSGINYPIDAFNNGRDDFLNDYWTAGLNLGLNYEYKISDHFALIPGVEYSHHFFDTYDRQPGIPEIRLISAEGNNSYLLKLNIYLKYFPASSPLPQGYIFTGFGYVSEKTGDIQLNYYDMNKGAFSVIEKFEDENYFVHVLGIGSRIIEINNFQFSIEGKYYSNYTNRLHFSLNAGIIFRL